jgi:hypothetical protein
VEREREQWKGRGKVTELMFDYRTLQIKITPLRVSFFCYIYIVIAILLLVSGRSKTENPHPK